MKLRDLGVAAIVVVVGAVFLNHELDKLQIRVPTYERPATTVKLEQNWSDDARRRFHHTAQGTRLVRYDWFKALEQPCLSPFGCAPFNDPKYLSNFGFIPGDVDRGTNPDGLPIGFAVEQQFFDPISKTYYPVVGLTCAACHTGELYYENYAVQIEGGPAMIEVAEFQKALGLAIGFNVKFPFNILRYGRFEKKVLGDGASQEQEAKLRMEFEAFVEAALAEKNAVSERHIYDNEAGFGRTDALTRIGNQVFGTNMRRDANYAPANAPVRFPQIWDASWFEWVQYNSSISDPLVRNIGEALGVRAVAKLYGLDATSYENSVNLPGLKELEELLSGKEPFSGLASPKWPAVFPRLDPRLVVQGAEIYGQRCQGCHLPPHAELLVDLKSTESPPKHWRKNQQGKWFLRVTDIAREKIGTDAHEAEDFAARTADTGDLNRGRVSAREGLQIVTGAIKSKYFDANNFTPAQRAEWSGYRDQGGEVVRDKLVYKARPLNGIWAAAPYLHNGSVPNLYQLLSPATERDAVFWVGSKRYDVANVGYERTEIPGASRFDTALPGNSNAGHEFKDGPQGRGVVGRRLSPAERRALVEYLKSL